MQSVSRPPASGPEGTPSLTGRVLQAWRRPPGIVCVYPTWRCNQLRSVVDLHHQVVQHVRAVSTTSLGGGRCGRRFVLTATAPADHVAYRRRAVHLRGPSRRVAQRVGEDCSCCRDHRHVLTTEYDGAGADTAGSPRYGCRILAIDHPSGRSRPPKPTFTVSLPRTPQCRSTRRSGPDARLCLSACCCRGAMAVVRSGVP